MRYLLDTHAFVWAVTKPERLGDRARDVITDATTDLSVSAATIWELATKVRLGKFREAEPLVDQYDLIVEHLGAAHVSIEPGHARRAGLLAWAHRDPFDRMIAAQAMLDHATLISADQAFASLGGLDTLW